MNRCVFLDRDGTVIVDRGYLSDPGGIELIPGAAEGLRLMSGAGYRLVIISNQSGVGRGLFGEDDLRAMDERLKSLLADEGIELAAAYYCIHTEGDRCDCRKPGTAFARAFAAEHDITLYRSFTIGDKTSDVEMARNLGCVSILVATGKGGSDGEYEVEPDFRVADLLEAARVILGFPSGPCA